MNQLGEIRKLSECVRPNIGIITNIGTAHIGNLGNRKNIAKAKMELTAGMNGGTLLVPYDEPLLDSVKNKKTFSLKNIEANYLLTIDTKGEIFLFKNQKLYTRSAFALSEEHHRKCLLAAASAAIEIGITSDDLSNGISKISADNTRQKVFLLENLHFYTDFYNSSRESVFAFIESAKEVRSISKKSLLLGDILELGDMSQTIHQEIGNYISPHIFNNLFLFGNHIEYIAYSAIEQGFPKERLFINHDLSDPKITAEQIRSNCQKGETIFMKASRAIRLERVLEYFRK